MAYDYVMNVASILYISCYIPELYANYKNKNANKYNVPEKIVIFTATAFAFAYSTLNYNPVLIINFGPLLVLDTIALIMRFYYAFLYGKIQIVDIENQIS